MAEVFGGFFAGSHKNIYKFNCTTETIETLSVTLPQTLRSACCAPYGTDIYIFGGYNNSILNTIYKFNCVTETIETLSATLPQAVYYARCSTFGSNIFIFGGVGSSSGYSKFIYNFSVSFELTANNVLLYCANSGYSFDLITNQVTIPIKNIYIGNSNNMAQLANAYLYDEAQTAWVNVNTGKVLTV